MQFLTNEANIFYISATEIASNGMADACGLIEKFILSRLHKYTFIFIEEPPHRWADDVPRQLNRLRSKIEQVKDTLIIHDLIFPSDVYKEMRRRNAGD